MKISKIKIKEFHKFKDFTIDLTYPLGHIKEGQPLDKICFIGQNGTGKTSILELIPKFLAHYDTQIISKIDLNSIVNNIYFDVIFGPNDDFFAEISFSETNQRSWTNGKKNNELFVKDDKQIWEVYNDIIHQKESTKLIYFPANLNFDIEDNVNDLNFTEKAIIDFSVDKVGNLWNSILEKIQTYQEKELTLRQEISKIVEKSSSDIKAIKEAVKRLENWKSSEFNPISDIAHNCLDHILARYKLKVKTEFEFRTKDDLGFIKIEDLVGNEIPHGLWSTGTKQIILTALPLYLLKPKNTVILLDEPERSLYPDIQWNVIEYYQSLSSNCQFLISTHSPMIASNFDPWEIIELKFDESGNIFRELYYAGENHVENYTLNPKFMRWDDILQRIFDLENDGSAQRKEKLDELATLNVKYKKLVKKGIENSDEAIEILKKIEELSKKLSKWD